MHNYIVLVYSLRFHTVSTKIWGFDYILLQRSMVWHSIMINSEDLTRYTNLTQAMYVRWCDQ